jgi:hypothetical protein
MLLRAGAFLEPIKEKWSKTIHNKLPTFQSSYDEDAARLIKGFVENIKASTLEMCPDLAGSLQLWEESSLRSRGPMQKHSRSIFDETIADAAREAHREVKPNVKECWLPVYHKCAEERGYVTFTHEVLNIEKLTLLLESATTLATGRPTSLTLRRVAVKCTKRAAELSKLFSKASSIAFRGSLAVELELPLLRLRRSLMS